MHGLESCDLNGMEMAIASITYILIPVVLLLVFVIGGADLLSCLSRWMSDKLNKK